MFNFSTITNALLAQQCVFCGADGHGTLAACPGCLAELPWQKAAYCPQCGVLTQGEVCGSCLKTPPYFDRTIATFEYGYPIDALLQHFKYHHALHLAQFLGTLLSRTLNATLQANAFPDAILAMPLHPVRMQERGFNQSLEIAKVVASQLQRPLLMHRCSRIKHTIPQAKLQLKDRASNIRDAFACKHLDGLRVALVDDVMTSGASLNELARMAKQAGAKEVMCWVLARTQPR